MDHADLDATAAAWLEAARAANQEITRLTEIRDVAIQHVKDALGDAETARLNGRPVATWKWSKPGQRIDRAKLESDYDIDLTGYMIDNTPARPFKILP